MDPTAIGPPPTSLAPSPDDILLELWREIVRIHPEAVPVFAPPAAALAKGSDSDAFRHPSGGRSLPALLALDGAAFITAAYGAILGRLPDEAGLGSAQAAMARGFSKIDVLGSLQRSPEGRASGRTMPGLRVRALALAHVAYRLPVLGGIARLGSALMRRAGLSRRLTAMQGGGRGLDRDAKLAGMETRLELLEAVHRRAWQDQAETVANHRARIDSLGRKVAALANEHALGLDRLAKRLDSVSRQMAALDETLTDPLVSLADGLEAQRRATLQLRADLEAEQRRNSMASDELRRTLELARPILPNLAYQIARQA